MQTRQYRTDCLLVRHREPHISVGGSFLKDSDSLNGSLSGSRGQSVDLVIVACLLAQNKWLAQTVDLRNEIRALPTKGVAASANNERKETVSIKEQVGILKQTLGSVAYGDRDLMKEDVSWTTDGQSLYYVSGGIQKI